MSEPPDPSTLLNLAQDKVAVLDESRRFRYLNAAVVDVLGYEPAELIGEDALEVVHPEDADRVARLFDDAVVGDLDTPGSVEYRCVTADGDRVWLASEVYTPEDTGLDGYVLSSRDVTEEVESKRRLQTIAEKSPDVLWMFSANWEELLFVNPAVEDVFGISPERLREDPTAFLDHVHPDDRPYVERAMRRLSAGESTNLDYRVNPDEEYARWVRVPGEPVFEDGEVVRIAGVAREVTEEYQRNRQLAVMDNLLRHNIRNDMNVVAGTAELIAEEASPEVADHAETVQDVAEDLVETADKQRAVIDLITRQASPEPIDVADALDEVVSEARNATDEATVEVDRPEAVRAFTVPEVSYALSELLSNAVEHAEESPEIAVDVETRAETVTVTVCDNCPPIPDEEYLVVAGRHEMTDHYHTVGMGLWLVYWVVDRSDGELAFDTHGDGNEVTLTLPRADGESL